MKHLFPRAVSATLALLALCGAAQAQTAGSWSVRVNVTRLIPQTRSGDLSAPSFPHTRVNVGADTQLTGGITYMLTDNWALDLPVGMPFKPVIYGAGAIAGVGRLDQTKVAPVALMAQYRFGQAQAAFRPFVGLGVVYSKFFKNRSTAALSGVTGGSPDNPTTASIDNRFGLMPQVGLVWNFNGRWFLNASYYKSFLKTTAHLSTGQHIPIRLNPDVFTLGVGYQF